MRIYDIAVFMLIFHVVGGAITVNYLDDLGFDGNELVIDDSGSAQRIQDAQNELAGILEGSGTQSGNPVADLFGELSDWTMTALSQLADALNPVFYYVAWMPLLMQQAHVPPLIAWPFFLVFIALEGIGMLQLIVGRNIKEYD